MFSEYMQVILGVVAMNACHYKLKILEVLARSLLYIILLDDHSKMFC